MKKLKWVYTSFEAWVARDNGAFWVITCGEDGLFRLGDSDESLTQGRNPAFESLKEAKRWCAEQK